MSESRIHSEDVDVDPLSERSVIIFGRDVSTIPCFRNSFLYGISIGMGVGFLAFLKTSRPQLSTHIGFGTFMATTLGYWFPCRYNWSKQKFDAGQLQQALQQQAIYEGTEKEREKLEVKMEHA
ncbi:cytochrome c oxidase assembly protein COX20, mitochondrial [Anopheles maculipalpis]|uniref:cytochrome c oxidase assembly protein COX20, mitochondrial n=1 Tax=Anopheles maculipalpis TaxID=1496333 RepID=UPI002159155B|nr:cytochrome c oxidase assembly protein COX20, mitochondrial [Anopheles maculipalpis]